MSTLYLITVWGDVEPAIEGPFDTDEERIARAAEWRDTEDPMGGAFRLDIDEAGTPTIAPFINHEIDHAEVVDDGGVTCKRDNRPLDANGFCTDPACPFSERTNTFERT